jgi:hypothetical protein
MLYAIGIGVVLIAVAAAVLVSGFPKGVRR